ncbi:MAG TPA: BTB/POZ domain-containing protein [Myxococcota bacterium]|nr:BTB/POZ domain-containing protein [Myxococcota bacterium]
MKTFFVAVFIVALASLRAFSSEFSSEGDLKFLEELKAQEIRFKILDNTVAFFVNKTRFPIDKFTLCRASEVFAAMLAGKCKESKINEIPLAEIDEAVFLKIIRLIYDKQFDPFASKNVEENWAKTAQLFEKLSFYALERFKKVVVEKIEISNKEQLGTFMVFADASFSSDERVSLGVVKKCQDFLVKERAYRLSSIVEFLKSYLLENAPSFLELASTMQKAVLTSVDHSSLGPSRMVPSKRFIISDDIKTNNKVSDMERNEAIALCASLNANLPTNKDLEEFELALIPGSETANDFYGYKYWTTTGTFTAEEPNEQNSPVSIIKNETTGKAYLRCVIWQ